MTTKKTKKPTKTRTIADVKIPENLYKGTLCPADTMILEKAGWRRLHSYVCGECYARGCEKCHKTGLQITLSDPDNHEHMVTGTPWHYPHTGAALRVRWDQHDHMMKFSIDSQCGHATFGITVPQMQELVALGVNSTAHPYGGNPYGDKELEFGVEGNLMGPPVMSIGGLKTKGQAAKSLSSRQEEAAQLLADNGFGDEAMLLVQALKHECFLVDAEENRKARDKIGDIEPGTILSRKGDTAVMVDAKGNEVTVNLDSDRSMLSMIG